MTTRIVIDPHEDPADYDRRYRAACARCQWEIGDPSWAYAIVNAFLYPDQDAEALKREMEA